MKFNLIREQANADAELWGDGEYEFEIVDAREKVSLAGNEMIELRVRIFRPDGASRTISDYLLAKRMGKLRNASVACGLLDKYQTGDLSGENFVGKRGRLKLAVEKSKNGYPDRNVVANYLESSLRAWD
jgi:hypothetical protein